jgi:two-component system, NarL family, response regulator LiaR
MAIIVSIIEDNQTFRQALEALILAEPEFILGQVYGSAEGALNMVKSPPDIAIVDIELPGVSGIELIRRLRVQGVRTEFLVCSMHDDDETIIKALENGASGYLLKESTGEEIKAALLEVLKGGAPMSPYIAKRVVSFFQKPRLSAEGALLSEREHEVLALLSKGLQYKEIAEHLFIATETVKKHLRNIYTKLHVQNKVEALNKFRSM